MDRKLSHVPSPPPYCPRNFSRDALSEVIEKDDEFEAEVRLATSLSLLTPPSRDNESTQRHRDSAASLATAERGRLIHILMDGNCLMNAFGIIIGCLNNSRVIRLHLAHKVEQPGWITDMSPTGFTIAQLPEIAEYIRGDGNWTHPFYDLALPALVMMFYIDVDLIVIDPATQRVNYRETISAEDTCNMFGVKPPHRPLAKAKHALLFDGKHYSVLRE